MGPPRPHITSVIGPPRPHISSDIGPGGPQFGGGHITRTPALPEAQNFLSSLSPDSQTYTEETRAPYVVPFDLKPLIEDGNLQIYTVQREIFAGPNFRENPVSPAEEIFAVLIFAFWLWVAKISRYTVCTRRSAYVLPCLRGALYR